MKISIDWLNQYLDRPTTAAEAEEVWTRTGFPIDGRETPDSDTVLDVEVTSNRADCLSHIGLARELAAATGRSLKKPRQLDASPTAPAQEIAGFSLDNQAPESCPLYTARILRGVRIGPSPDWLQKRLLAIGLRPVNNVVDITNFVMHETGHPLHAFDLKKLKGKKVVIRPATANEAFAAIDHSTHKLKAGMLVIADADRPLALAGIMGGLESEISESTTDILLEAACFEPLIIRSTGRALRLDSDSSYRFERGVAHGGVEGASLRAAELILELAGGKAEPGLLRSGQVTAAPTVSMRPAACVQLLGIPVPTDRMVELLAAIGLQPVLKADRITCTIPPFRSDLQREVDLFEEIIRLHGFQHLPIESQMRLTVLPPQARVEARKCVQRLLLAHGFYETISFSFLPGDQARPFTAAGSELIRINDEKKKATPFLRPSLLPSLLACRKLNQDAGNHHVRLFERASSFARTGEQYIEQRNLSLLMDVEDIHQSLRSLRGILEELLSSLGWNIQNLAFESVAATPIWATTAAAIRVPSSGKTLGVYGLASDAVQKQFDLQSSVLLAELDETALLGPYPPKSAPQALPAFPSIERDLSLVVEEPLPWAKIEGLIRDAKLQHLERLDFVTTYRGKPIERGRKSVTLRLIFRDPQRTLRHEEVNGQIEAVTQRLKTELKAELRVN